jgi:dolichol-phosphate mannosyltransferase
MLRRMREGADIVTASYSAPGAHAYGVPVLRRVMSIIVNLLFEMTLPLPGVRTYTNGFRAYRVGALKAAEAQWGNRLIEEAGFAGGTELFLKTAINGARTAEIPFDLHYENRGAGLSKIRVWDTIRGYLALIRRMRPVFRHMKR